MERLRAEHLRLMSQARGLEAEDLRLTAQARGLKAEKGIKKQDRQRL